MEIEYNHSQNLHSLEGPKAALPLLFPDGMPHSILDVGCGAGLWLRAALDEGVTDVFGIDGVDIPPENLLFDPHFFKQYDLTAPVDLSRKFNVVLCLEVAEHLDAKYAPVLLETLTRHSDRILFSAACPGQSGQHHVNCQWPEYWQDLFNSQGYVCEDSSRWQIWPSEDIEPWYRQNLFSACRNLDQAGKEPRIRAVLHPGIIPSYQGVDQITMPAVRDECIKQVEKGSMPAGWYFSTLVSGLLAKLQRSFSKNKGS